VLSGLARALARHVEVRSVLLHGSYGTEAFELGRSDLDVLAVIDDLDPAAEARLLGALRKPYRCTRIMLPVDLCAIAAGQFGPAAGWYAFSRMQVGRDRPVRRVRDWRLVCGAEPRVAEPWEPPGQLNYITESEVSDAISTYANARSSPGRALAKRLNTLAEYCRREDLQWASARALRDHVEALLAGGDSDQAVGAVAATLQLLDEHRAHHAITYERRGLARGDERVELPSDGQRAEARRLLKTLNRRAAEALRSATLYVQPLGSPALLLLEAGDCEAATELIRWTLRGGAQAAGRHGFALQVLTSRLAEDSWRSGLRWIPLSAGAIALAGDPLAARMGQPAAEWSRLLVDYRAASAVAAARRELVGHGSARRDGVLLTLAAVRRLAAGEAPITAPSELVRTTPELRRALGRASFNRSPVTAIDSLERGAWGTLALELWRGWRFTDERAQRAPALGSASPGH
jgi:hypothetical protein